MSKKVLVAYDGSELSIKALEEAKNQINLIPDLELHVLSVVTVGGPTTNIAIARSIAKEISENLEPEMEELHNNLEAEGIKNTSKVALDYIHNNPGFKLCEYAEENNIDLIILGSRGLGDVKKLILGSVSNYVVQHAKCQVLIVK